MLNVACASLGVEVSKAGGIGKVDMTRLNET